MFSPDCSTTPYRDYTEPDVSRLPYAHHEWVFRSNAHPRHVPTMLCFLAIFGKPIRDGQVLTGSLTLDHGGREYFVQHANIAMRFAFLTMTMCVCECFQIHDFESGCIGYRSLGRAFGDLLLLYG